MLKSIMLSRWNFLPKGVTIKDLLLLKVDHNRYPVQWKIHNTT